MARMTAQEICFMAFRFPESLSEAKLKFQKLMRKAIPINTKKAMKFGLGVFQGKVLFLNIILRLHFIREAEIVTLTRNNCQLPSLFTNFKIRHKITKIVIFCFADSLVGYTASSGNGWYMLM